MRWPWFLLMLAVPSGAAARPCALDARRVPVGDATCARGWMDRNLHVNDLTVVGTHNSYKQAIPSAELAAIARRAPAVAPTLDYAHAPLAAELDAGARTLEIDPYYDPAGGRFATPRGPAAAGADLGEGWRQTMRAPGFKVFHVVDLDVRSSCPTLRDCLSQIVRWSDAHPDHVPITVLINAKDELEVKDGVAPLPLDAAAYDALDAEIREVVPAAKLVTPDQVQGRYPTLRDAVTRGGWPTLAATRGRLFLYLEDDAAHVLTYQGARRSLEGRAMFVNAADEASPAAAFITLNDPVGQADRIARAVRLGLIVRTRADEDTVEARRNSVARRDRALAGGAQLVSTDYLMPDRRLSDYRVGLGAAAVCNPVRMKDRCEGRVVEGLGR